MRRMIYRAMSGDTWDAIARALYGDENKALELMRENPGICLIAVFQGGEEVLLPTKLKISYGQEIEAEQITYTPANAPWR